MMASLDKWRTLRATHINANLGCLDYHVQWDHSSYFILVQIFTLTTYQARFTIFQTQQYGVDLNLMAFHWT